MTAVELPEGLRRNATLAFGGRGAEWFDALPQQVDEFVQRWNLRVDLPPGRRPWHGMCGLVLPVLSADEQPAVLKLSPADPENEHEHTALRTWDGDGAVRLLAADGPRRTLLLERLDGDHDLHRLPVDAATIELGRLLVRLAVPAPSVFTRIAVEAPRWVEEWPRRWRELAITAPATLLEQAVAAARDLGPGEPGPGADGSGADGSGDADALVHTDLHYENALAAGPYTDPRRGAWLAIDPKPLAGDPAFGITPLLWNRLDDLGPVDREAGLRRRLALACEAAGLDVERARRWSVAREVQNLIWYAEDGSPDDYARSLWVATTLAD